MTLFLVRHGQSTWNRENRFTGFRDVPLTPQGQEEARRAGELLYPKGIPHTVFTSALQRAQHTAYLAMGDMNVPLVSTAALNERDYGDLTGLNKAEIAQQYGPDQVHQWRRSYTCRPPHGESLQDVVERVSEYYQKNIQPLLLSHPSRSFWIVAHGNSLRALLVHLRVYPESHIEYINLPTGHPICLTHLESSASCCRTQQSQLSYLNSYHFQARQILDSRGIPTIEVDIVETDSNKIIGRGSAPSGASCGKEEALELRDEEETHFNGKGVTRSVQYVHQFLNHHLPLNQHILKTPGSADRYLIGLDSSREKETLGGNTTTAISWACWSALHTLTSPTPLFHSISALLQSWNADTRPCYLGHPPPHKFPLPMANVINGGKHAEGNFPIQEMMIVPDNTYDIPEAIEMIVTVYHELKKLIHLRYGGSACHIGDEGGFVPPLETLEEGLSLLTTAATQAGYQPGQDLWFALDCAANEWYHSEHHLYHFHPERIMNRYELTDYYLSLIDKYPLISIEDPFEEGDTEAWHLLTQKIKEQDKKVRIVGDDLFTTQTHRVKKGLDEGWATALLVKVNQVGTVVEALEAAQACQQRDGWVIVSHRSGETEDTTIADLAVGMGMGQIKTGSISRTDRTCKYNQLLRIEEELGKTAKIANLSYLGIPR
mgnify:CR=1 FL=1